MLLIKLYINILLSQNFIVCGKVLNAALRTTLFLSVVKLSWQLMSNNAFYMDF